MKQLTRKQLQNDLDAMSKHRDMAETAYTNEYQRRTEAEARSNMMCTAVEAAYAERDDWRAAFKTISKLVK